MTAFADSFLQSLARRVAEVAVLPHQSGLHAVLREFFPPLHFTHAFSRGGWYRPGRVLRPDGEEVAEAIDVWAETLFGDADDLSARLTEDTALAELILSRYQGRTHFFVAAYDTRPEAFYQIEVEELSEVLDRRLFDPDAPPADLFELIEPAHPLRLAPEPVRRPFYRLRRVQDIAALFAPAQGGAPTAMQRFLREWALAGQRTSSHFKDHWVFALREHRDRFGNLQLAASPLARHARKLDSFQWNLAVRGVALAEQVHAFDRIAGHPESWYFHLVAGGRVPRALAYALQEDLAADYRYLSDIGMNLLMDWIDAPYAV